MKQHLKYTMTFILVFYACWACGQAKAPAPEKFTLEQHTDMNAGNGLIHPQRFRMLLPAGLKTKQLISYEYSLFHYPNQQYIIVVMHPTAALQEKLLDSTWVPDPSYMRHHVNMMAEVKDEHPYLPKTGRKSQAFRKQGNEIILLNIKPDQYQHFLSAVKTFSILPDTTPVVRHLPARD